MNLPSGFKPGEMAREIGGPESAAAHIDIKAVDAERADAMRRSGAMHYVEGGPEGNHDVYVELKITSRQVKGGSRQEFVQIAEAVGHAFDGNREYPINLGGAPEDLRLAVMEAANKISGAKRKPAEFSGVERIRRETIVRVGKAVEASMPKVRPEQPTPLPEATIPSVTVQVDTAPTAGGPLVEVERAEDDFPEHSKVPYDQARMNRIPAPDQEIFATYRAKGWRNLGKKQREHYQELKARLEATQGANAAK